MVQLAIGHIDKLKIDDREIRKNSPSYSYETFKELKMENPTADLIWIMGTDTFSNIETWFKYEKFLDEVNILLLKRPGFEVDENSFVNDLFKSKRTMRFSDFFGSTGNIFLLNINPIEITSTEIRNLIRNEKNVTKFLNPEVHAVIKEYKLYESK